MNMAQPEKTFEQLLDEFADAEFDAGEWKQEYSDDDWEDVHAKIDQSRQALIAWVKKHTKGE
jgi:hypothetical protein